VTTNEANKDKAKAGKVLTLFIIWLAILCAMALFMLIREHRSSN